MLCTNPGIRYQLLFPSHQCCNPVIEGHQTCQAQFALNEAMVPVTEYLCVLHVFCHAFLEDLLHNLARHRDEADQLVVYWISSLSCFKNEDCFPLFPVTGNCSFSNMKVVEELYLASSLRTLRCPRSQGAEHIQVSYSQA